MGWNSLDFLQHDRVVRDAGDNVGGGKDNKNAFRNQIVQKTASLISLDVFGCQFLPVLGE